MATSSTALPSVTGTSTRPINILLINPNATPSMTLSCLRSLAATLPADVTVHGFTAPPTSHAPTAIESRTDAVLSAASTFRALHPLLTNRTSSSPSFDALLVACFSAHPLIPMLREEFTLPVAGIMEAALYASRLCGEKLGVLTTSERSRWLHADAITTTYGLHPTFSVGCEASAVRVLELETKPREEVYGGLVGAAQRLVARGADCVCLGCAGMTEMAEVCREAVGGGGEVMVIDGVAVGVHFLVGLVREGLGTAKRGSYSSSGAVREGRGQDWI